MEPNLAKSHFCPDCGKRYISARNLSRHARKHHGKAEDLDEPSKVGTNQSASGGNLSLLSKSLPFFVNCRGRYQFNVNEDKRHINCPFCVLHRTSLYGLAKHCAVKHSRQYLAWRAGQYGRIQLRRIPPSDAALHSAMQALVDARILSADVPMEGAVAPAELLPPCPPLVDCRGLGRMRLLEEKRRTESYESDHALSWKDPAELAAEHASSSLFQQPIENLSEDLLQQPPTYQDESFFDYYQRQNFSYQQPETGVAVKRSNMFAKNFPFGPLF